jgi:hypothetical protein
MVRGGTRSHQVKRERHPLRGEPERADRRRAAGAVLVSVLALATVACSAASASPTPAPVIGALGSVQPAGGIGGGQGGQGSRATAGPSATPPPTPPAPSASPSASPSDSPGVGGPPYKVKQTTHLGDETLSGSVCDTARLFQVTVATSRVTFAMPFTPTDGVHGTIAYTYAWSDLGESHDATGTYQISIPDSRGVLHVAVDIRDHVVFNGFDGTIPLPYKFDLVPADVPACATR